MVINNLENDEESYLRAESERLDAEIRCYQEECRKLKREKFLTQMFIISNGLQDRFVEYLQSLGSPTDSFIQLSNDVKEGRIPADLVQAFRALYQEDLIPLVDDQMMIQQAPSFLDNNVQNHH